MDLTSDQLAWLMVHFYYPVKFEGGRQTLPKECIYLESQGLVVVEQFPVVDIDLKCLIIVVTLTRYGHEVISRIDPIGILQRWGDRLSDAFLEEYVIPNFTLEALPELLVGDNSRWRRCAARTVKRLQEKSCGI